ncbi:MAG: phosphotransferase [Bacteroidales bacterium]|nr:phosphotransferase [Bacteroidales bacterium]
MKEPLKIIEALYTKWSGSPADNIKPLPESGSYRRYYRITSGHSSLLGVYNNDNRENQAFIYLNHQLLKTGNKVPEVMAADLENHVYLEQDLGDVTLFEHLASLRKNSCSVEEVVEVYKRVIDAMPALQVHAAAGLDYSRCYPRAEFDVQSMMWDMNYFKYCLLKPLKIGFYEQDLEDDFVKIADWLIGSERNSFMFRDFQSRNIMIRNDQLYFIDFQGGRKGPLQYDLASLLFEAKTHLSDSVRSELLNHYVNVFSSSFSWFNPEKFLSYYYGFVYLRLMQAMGAYGFRGYIERKPLFLQSLPYAIETLAWLNKNHPIPLQLASLPEVFDKLISLPRSRQLELQQDLLTVSINSFAFKEGIPQDVSGNGGGFVFDCRCLDNPGRYEAYKELSGCDQKVVEFLSEKPDVQQFTNNCFSMAEQAVEAYQKRGFTHLMISFGCTGGQHRSVYMAEKLAGHLKNKYELNVVLYHQELEKRQR